MSHCYYNRVLLRLICVLCIMQIMDMTIYTSRNVLIIYIRLTVELLLPKFVMTNKLISCLRSVTATLWTVLDSHCRFVCANLTKQLYKIWSGYGCIYLDYVILGCVVKPGHGGSKFFLISGVPLTTWRSNLKIIYGLKLIRSIPVSPYKDYTLVVYVILNLGTMEVRL
jgi:hypothetical protein